MYCIMVDLRLQQQSFSQGYVAPKAKNIYDLTLYRKCLLMRGLVDKV